MKCNNETACIYHHQWKDLFIKQQSLLKVRDCAERVAMLYKCGREDELEDAQEALEQAILETK